MARSPTTALRTVIRAAVVLVGLGLAHTAHRGADARREVGGSLAMQFIPSPDSLRAASMGQQTLLADVMWIRAVLQFVELYEHPSEHGTTWLRQMLRSVMELDPDWRTAPFYGGSFMRLVGDVDESDRIYELAHERMPDDPHFPFSIGMNAYLVREDPVRAAEWVKRAAEIPGAPKWYGATVAALIDGRGQRRAAMRYLREELDRTEDPGVRRALERKLTELTHDEWVELIAERKAQREAQLGRSIESLAELGELPADPYGEGWVLAPDGVVRSQAADESLARKQLRAERALLLKPAWR